MSKMEWKYVIPLKDEEILEDLEIKLCFPIPSDLMACIKKDNGGMPSKAKLVLREGKTLIFGGLLSFNEGDEDSFFNYINMFKDTQSGKLLMFPFGLDPFGNFYCIQKGKVIFFDCESNTTISLAESFTEFLDMLQ